MDIRASRPLPEKAKGEASAASPAPDTLAQIWPLVKDVLADVLDVPEADRPAYLAQHCPDVRLRAAVQSLLGHTTSGLTLSASLEPDDDELPTGTHVGGYVIVDTLGRGGMGRVYLAKDSKLRRKVALKSVLAAQPNNPGQRAGMLREAQAAAQTSHVNVATIYEFLEDNDRAFIVMEYVEGRNLTAVLQQPLSPERVIEIGRQCAAGIAAAHAKGVVHRDLKPANILLTSDGTVKILDFGVAGLTEVFTTVSGSMASIDQSRPGQWGTPGYMAPEQLLSKRFDQRTDIFSLGVVLFELATGQRAYPAIDFLGLVEEMAKPLRRADSVDRRVPRALADVIARATAIDPADRFATAAALSAALQGPRPLPASRPRPWWLRVLTMAGIACAVLTGLGYFSSLAFNLALDQVGYADDNALIWLKVGFRSVVQPVFVLAVGTLIIALGIVTRNVIGPDSAGVKRVERTVRGVIGLTRKRLRLADPLIRASWLLLFCTVALGAACWVYRDYIPVFFTKISAATPAQLSMLATPPGAYMRQPHQDNYQFIFTVLVVLFGAGWFAVGRDLLRSAGTTHRLLLAAGCIVTLLAVAALEVQYRFLLEESHRPRVSYRGSLCYLLGERNGEGLLFCPALPNRMARVPNVHDSIQATGITENIFTPFLKH